MFRRIKVEVLFVYTYTPSSFYGLLSHINLAILPRGISLRINRHSSHHKPGFVIFSFSPSLRGHARKPKPQSFIRLLLFFCDSFFFSLSLSLFFFSLFTTLPTSRWIIFSTGTLFIQALYVCICVCIYIHIYTTDTHDFILLEFSFPFINLYGGGRLRGDDFIAV